MKSIILKSMIASALMAGVAMATEEKVEPNICTIDTLELETHNIISYCAYGKIVLMFQNETGLGKDRFIQTVQLQDVKCSCNIDDKQTKKETK